MQTSIEIQNTSIQKTFIQAAVAGIQGYTAAVHEPTEFFPELDAWQCKRRDLGVFPTQSAAVQACKSFIDTLSGDFKAWASYSVTPAQSAR